MQQMKTLAMSALIVLFLIAASSETADAKSCVKWRAAMAEGRIALMPSGKSVLIKTFVDFTKKPGDEWLSVGLRDYVGDLISSSKQARVFYGLTAAHGGSSFDFQIDGMYQHLDNNLRVFIKLLDGGGKLLAQKEVVFPYPDNSEFFSRTAQAITELMKEMGLSSDQSAFDAVRGATASTRAYEAYSKGRDQLEEYTQSKAEAAIANFTETKRLDYASPLGYQGIAAVNDFLGISSKLAGRPYDVYFIRAEAEFAQMTKLTKPMNPVFGYIKAKPTDKENSPTEIKDRFVMANAFYKEGMSAVSRGDHKSAAAAFRKSAELAPEDATAWERLANSESVLGNTEAATKAQNKASAIDPCIGNP